MRSLVAPSAPEKADCWFDEEPTAMLECLGGCAATQGCFKVTSACSHAQKKKKKLLAFQHILMSTEHNIQLRSTGMSLILHVAVAKLTLLKVMSEGSWHKRKSQQAFIIKGPKKSIPKNQIIRILAVLQQEQS